MPQQEPQQDPTIPPAAVAGPPVLDPTRWEDFEGFRETFLLNFTDPRDNTALRAVGRVLYHLVLEAAHVMPGPPESWVRAHIRAAVADLRFLQGFLAFVGEERGNTDLPAAEEDLCRTVARKARILGRVADGIEVGLGEIRPAVSGPPHGARERYAPRNVSDLSHGASGPPAPGAGLLPHRAGRLPGGVGGSFRQSGGSLRGAKDAVHGGERAAPGNQPLGKGSKRLEGGPGGEKREAEWPFVERRIKRRKNLHESICSCSFSLNCAAANVESFQGVATPDQHGHAPCTIPGHSLGAFKWGRQPTQCEALPYKISTDLFII